MSPRSLWEALDGAIEAGLAAAMGEESDYTELQIQSIEIGDTWDPDHMAKPGILIVSNDADLGTGPHGAGPHALAAYDYMIVAVAEEASYREAKASAQALHGRLITALCNWPAILGQAMGAIDTGEQAERLRFDRSRIEIRGRQGATRGKYLGIAVVAVQIDTMI